MQKDGKHRRAKHNTQAKCNDTAYDYDEEFLLKAFLSACVSAIFTV